MMVQRTEAQPDPTCLLRRRSTAGNASLKISIDENDSVANAFNNASSCREMDFDSVKDILKYCRGSPRTPVQIAQTHTPHLGVQPLEVGSTPVGGKSLQIPSECSSMMQQLPSPRMMYNEKADESDFERAEFSFPSPRTSPSRPKSSTNGKSSSSALGAAARNSFLLGAFNKSYTVESMSNDLLKKDRSKGEMFTPTYTVVFLGELSVGKSALCRKFFRSGNSSKRSNSEKRDSEYGFDEDEDLQSPNSVTDLDGNTTTSASHHVYERPATVDGHGVRIRMLDINAEKHRRECGDCGEFEPYLETGDAFVLTYSVADRGTFKTAMEMLCRVSRLHADLLLSLPIILVGNKCDLVRKRQVTTSRGVKLAAKYDIKFIETSASLNQNVVELFEGVVQQIQLRRRGDNPENLFAKGSAQRGKPAQSAATASEDLKATTSTSKRASSLHKKRKKRVFARRLTEFLGISEKDTNTQRTKSCQDLSIL